MKNLSIILLFLTTVFGLNTNLSAKSYLYDTQDDCEHVCYSSCYKNEYGKFYCFGD